MMDTRNVGLDTVVEDVMSEYYKAVNKYGKFNSLHEGYAVIKEEVDELWDEIKGQQRNSHVYLEAKHVAAMAIRFMMECVE